MAPRKQNKGTSKSATATPKKRVGANGFKLPDPIPAGQVITDVAKNTWVLGHSIGQGGFGEIYLASNDPSRPVCDTDKYVVKVEPHSNGPLFTEMHCYMRIAKPDLIDAWMKDHKLKRFGMPKYLGSGSFDYNNQKYRFMVMERFGSDLQKILEQHNKKFSFKTVYQVGLEIIDVLEYIHDKGYIHADIKASNLLVGFQKGTENQVFLVDYGLACRYAIRGVHKEYKYDGRKAHDGTIEFTSRDAHIGAHSRRGDLEILGYNMCQWLCARLPWEDNLTDCDSVAKHKRWYMDNVDKLMDTCFPDDAPIPPGLQEFLSYVANLTFDEMPDYEKCRDILRYGLIERGYKDDGKLVFMSATPKPISKKPKSRLKKRGLKRRRSDEEENLCGDFLAPPKVIRTSPRSPCKSTTNNRINTRLCPRKSYVAISLSTVALPLAHTCADPEDVLIEKENEKMQERQRLQRPKRLVIKKDTSLDNPTPAMLALLAKRREKTMSPPVCNRKHKHKLNCVTSQSSSGKSSPTFEDPPTDLTPEMEAVIRRRQMAQQSEYVDALEDPSPRLRRRSVASVDSAVDAFQDDSSNDSNCFFPTQETVQDLRPTTSAPTKSPLSSPSSDNNKIVGKTRHVISSSEMRDLLDIATRTASSPSKKPTVSSTVSTSTALLSSSKKQSNTSSSLLLQEDTGCSDNSATDRLSSGGGYSSKRSTSFGGSYCLIDDPYEFVDEEVHNSLELSPTSYKLYVKQNSLNSSSSVKDSKTTTILASNKNALALKNLSSSPSGVKTCSTSSNTSSTPTTSFKGKTKRSVNLRSKLPISSNKSNLLSLTKQSVSAISKKKSALLKNAKTKLMPLRKSKRISIAGITMLN